MQFDRDNPGLGQAGFYAACKNGEYLIWQLRQLPWEVLKPYRGHLSEIAERAAKRTMEYAAVAYADYANYAAALNAARQKALQMQADDIHQLIPVWPGD